MASRFAEENEYEIETPNNTNNFILSDHANRLNAAFGVNSLGKYQFAVGDKHAYLNSHPLFKFHPYKIHPCYKFIEEIGRGGYGQVIKVKWKNSVFKEEKFALKRCNLYGDEGHVLQQLREVEVNMQLTHSNIAHFHNYWIEIDEKPNGYIAIWLNLTIEEHEKSLKVWMNENKHRDYNECLLIFIMIADGLRYLHSQKIIHRDLKPGNILMNGNVMQGGKVKIADFGLSIFPSAEQHSKNSYHSSTGGEGIYSAPEIENGEQYNEKADVYSLGLILFELLAEFRDEEEKEESIAKYKKSKNELFPEIFKSRYQAERVIILRLTEFDSTKRAISAKAYDDVNDLLASKYFACLSDPHISGEFQETWVAKGKFAEVFIQKFTDEKEYALKKIALKSWYQPFNARIADELVKANRIMRDNEEKSFIVPFFCQYNKKEKKVCAQMELCKDNLETLNENNTFDNEDTFRLFSEISIGLNYLHDRRIIHRDMKPSNIFLGYDGKWKISDYCLAIIRLQNFPTESDYYRKCKEEREPFYAAPEQTMNEDGKEVDFKSECKIDIFAFGLIMIELITPTLRDKYKLFKTLNNVRDNHKLPDDMDEEYNYLVNLIYKMTEHNPSIRPDSFEVKNAMKIPQTPTQPDKHLPELWNAPTKNTNFIGRRELLEKIEHHYNKDHEPVILTACHGLGGIGKTQLALEFVWQHYKNYKGVVWFNAETRDRLQNDYIKLGKQLNIIQYQEKKDADEFTSRVKVWLEDESHAGWLLVYDNAPNYESIRELLPVKKGKLLVTSRYSVGWPQESISINVFTIEESRDYMEKVIGTQLSGSDIPLIDTLAEVLGRLPLAIAIASAYITMNKLNISSYLETYQKRKKESLSKKKSLISDELFPDSHDKIQFTSLYITWDITMEKINRESLLASNLLNACACLANNDIPYFLLEEFAETSENNPTTPPEIFEEALGTLDRYSMITINEKNHNASIHQLVQEVIRLKWEDNEIKHNFVAVFNLLENSVPKDGGSWNNFDKKLRLLPHFEKYLSHLDALEQKSPNQILDMEKEIRRKWLSRDQWEIDLSPKSIRIYINRKLSSMFGYLINIPRRGIFNRSQDKFFVIFIVSLLARWYYYILGESLRAKELWERELRAKEEKYGPAHPEVAVTLTNLGNAHGSLGNYEKQRELLERAIIIKEKHYGPNDTSVAVTLTNLGRAHGSLGDYKKQRELLERAIIIKEKHYGLDHPNVVVTLNNLGRAHGSLGDYEKQRELLERAMLIEEKHYGSYHPSVAIILTNLGNAYGSLGDYKKQRELLERAIIINEKHYGPDHPAIAVTLSILGNAYGSLGDYKKQRELLERAIIIKEKHYGPDHPSVAATLTNLGNAHGSLRDYKKQLELLERAIIIQEKHYGTEHPSVAATLMNLGCAYGYSSDYQKQREFIERAMEIEERFYGSDHPEVAITLMNLGCAYGCLGDYHRQQEFIEQALKIEENHYGPDHPEVAILLTNLGIAYGCLGDHQKAREFLERSMKIKERYYGLDHPEVAITLINLGFTYGSFDDYHKQREFLKQSLKIEERHGPDHPEVSIILANFGIAYRNLEDAQKAHKIFERALKIFEINYGFDHQNTTKRLKLLEILSDQIMASKQNIKLKNNSHLL